MEIESIDQITEKIYKPLKQLVINNKNLQFPFNKSNSQIEKFNFTKLEESLIKCQQLTDLTLSFDNSNINDEFFIKVIGNLSYCKSLQILNLSFEGNNISDEGMGHLETQLMSLKNLTKLQLYLSQNKFRFQGVMHICKGISECKKLESLQIFLNNNNIGDQSIQAIGEVLAKEHDIKELILFLSKTEISDKGISNLLDNLSQCQNIQSLYLQMINDLQFRLEDPILGRQFSNLKNLQKLVINIDWNRIEKQCMLKFLKELKNSKSIRDLTLTLQSYYYTRETIKINIYKILRLVALSIKY